MEILILYVGIPAAPENALIFIPSHFFCGITKTVTSLFGGFFFGMEFRWQP
jgi:hypothetical protein